MSKIFEGKTGVIYAGMLGLILSDIIPTPGDALYFYKVKKWRDQWSKGELTSKQFWTREAFGYYAFNSSWWALVGLSVYITPGDYRNKLKTLLYLAGAGIVAAVLLKNIQKDKREMLSEINALKERIFGELKT